MLTTQQSCPRNSEAQSTSSPAAGITNVPKLQTPISFVCWVLGHASTVRSICGQTDANLKPGPIFSRRLVSIRADSARRVRESSADTHAISATSGAVSRRPQGPVTSSTARGQLWPAAVPGAVPGAVPRAVTGRAGCRRRDEKSH